MTNGTRKEHHGGPPFDPSFNTAELVEAAVERLDDLRAAAVQRSDDLREGEEKLSNERYKHVEFVAKLRASHTTEMRAGDNDRMAAQRREDQVTAAADKKTVLDAVQALAATTESVRLQLEKRVADTAETLSKAKTESDKATEIRIAALEKTSYTGAGEKAVSDPATVLLAEQMKKLIEGSGERRGGEMFMSRAITVAALVIAAASFLLK